MMLNAEVEVEVTPSEEECEEETLLDSAEEGV